MVRLNDIKNMVTEIPTHKLENLIEYVKGKNSLSSFSVSTIKNDLSLTSSEATIVKKIFRETQDGDMLSIAIESVLANQFQNEQVNTKLVMTGDFHHDNVSYTHTTVYEMIRKAKARITIVGYWVYKLDELFQELSRIQEERKGLRIRFILDDAKKWESEIKEDWNTKFISKLEIFTPNKKELKKIHSKIIIIDDSEILITSANLTINAMEENLEAGIWSCDKKIINACSEVITDLVKRQIITKLPKKKF